MAAAAASSMLASAARIGARSTQRQAMARGAVAGSSSAARSARGIAPHQHGTKRGIRWRAPTAREARCACSATCARDARKCRKINAAQQRGSARCRRVAARGGAAKLQRGMAHEMSVSRREATAGAVIIGGREWRQARRGARHKRGNQSAAPDRFKIRRGSMASSGSMAK